MRLAKDHPANPRAPGYAGRLPAIRGLVLPREDRAETRRTDRQRSERSSIHQIARKHMPFCLPYLRSRMIRLNRPCGHWWSNSASAEPGIWTTARSCDGSNCQPATVRKHGDCGETQSAGKGQDRNRDFGENGMKSIAPAKMPGRILTAFA